MILRLQWTTFFVFGMLFGAAIHQLTDYKARQAADKATAAMLISLSTKGLCEIQI